MQRHARSVKLLSEGRLKVMLNSDGEIENQEIADVPSIDSEVGSSTAQSQSNATQLNKKLLVIELNMLGKLNHL